MKKFLLTTTMLVGFVAIAQAQQGRVGINTTTPAATLDVVANTTDATRPDALLVPRMTRAQLYAKDAAYAVPQNGAIVFVNTIDGTATAKTINVTATGFYYYNSTPGVWVAVGGNSTPSFQIQKGRLHTASTGIVWQADDYSVVTTAMGGTSTLLLPPATSLPLHSVRCVSANGPGNIGWDAAAVTGITRTINNLPTTITSAGSFCFIVVDNAGTNNWGILTGR